MTTVGKEPRRKLLVIGTAALFDRVAQAEVGRCDLFQAQTLADGRHILAAHPDLALLVLQGTGTAGGLLQALKAEHPRIRVLLLTAEQALVRAAAALELGDVVGVLPRDVAAESLRRAIEHALQRVAQGERRDPARLPVVPQSPVAQVRDEEGAFHTGGPGPGIHLNEDWLQVIAHDLRTPLGIVNSYAALLLNDAEYVLSAPARELVARMQDNGEWMLAFVDGILDLAMVPHRRPALRYEATRLPDLLGAVAERMRGMAEPRGVRIEWSAGRSTASYRLDRTRVEQVLHNLIANAVKYSSPGETVRVSGRMDGGKLTFEVRDSGRGMSREEAANAFTKFSALAGGRGLGLAIAKAIVELHGGRIWVRSEPSRGSTFHFTIVPAPRERKADRAGAARAGQGAGK